MAVNGIYIQQKDQIKKELRKKSSVPSIQLFDLLEEKEYRRFQQAVHHLPFRSEKKLLQYSYRTAAVPPRLFPPEFLAFLQQVLGKKPRQWTAYKLSWKEYRLLHDKSVEKPGTDVLLDLTEHWPEKAGGAVIYSDTQGDAYPLAVQKNVLSIVVRKKGVQKFFQYVNHYGKGKERLFVVGTC